MNTTNRTLLFVAVAGFAALSAAGVKYINRPVANADFADVGQEFYPEFTDPLQATSLSVVKYDTDAREALNFSVKQDDKGVWVIPSHHDYPAEAADRLARTATSFIGAKKLALHSRNKDDWGRYPKKRSRNARWRPNLMSGAWQTLIGSVLGDDSARGIHCCNDYRFAAENPDRAYRYSQQGQRLPWPVRLRTSRQTHPC